MTAHGTLCELAPGLVIWGLGGGTTFPAMFGAAATGIPLTSKAPPPGSPTLPARSARPGVAAIAAISAAHAAPVGSAAALTGLRTAWLVAGAATAATAFAVTGLPRRRPGAQDRQPEGRTILSRSDRLPRA